MTGKTPDSKHKTPDKPQEKTRAWHDQWTHFEAPTRFLFEEWIAPTTVEDFRDQDVLEGGCGGGQHTALVVEAGAKSVTAVDLNTADIARERNKDAANVTFVEDDLGTMDLGRQFDVVFSIGVVHHTDDPDRTFENLYRHCRPGGRMILWVYSAEGNGPARFLVEPARRLFIRHLPLRAMWWLSCLLTACMVPPIQTIYRLPLRFLPYYEYFANFRRMTFQRNALNVFDKLNAPQTHFITRERAARWFSPERFEAESISMRRYAGVSHSLVGIKREDAA